MKIVTHSVCLVFFSIFYVLNISSQERTIQPDALMLRFPTVSSEQISFVYAEDLWIVPKTGGVARRITSAKGMEKFPRFSPDGSQIAFTGNYDGNQDIYTIPSQGGEPERVTHHPDEERIVDWYPDGNSILMASSMESPSPRFAQFFKQPVPGGLPSKLPLFYGEFGSFNQEGDKIAFQYLNRQFRTWKRYQGGQASELWIYDVKKDSAYRITDYPGTDAIPMWYKDEIYFLSDRGSHARLNIYSYHTKTKRVTQITYFSEFDVKFPSKGPEDIVFENGGKLYLLRLRDHNIQTVSVKVPSDLISTRPTYKPLQPYISAFSLSPSGKRALFCARGKIITVPQKEGYIRNLTPTSGVSSRYPVWSPDGKFIAYFADNTGEYELYIMPADGKGEVKQLTFDSQTFYYNPVWSPDSKQIAFSDKTGSLFNICIEEGELMLVDRDEYFELRHYKWSPDSRWITYTKNKNLANAQIKVFDTKEEEDYTLTSGFYNDNMPEFSEDGKYLYFYSNRDFQTFSPGLQILAAIFGGSQLYGVTLNKHTPSPVAPKNDDEGTEEESLEDELEEPEEEEIKDIVQKEETSDLPDDKEINEDEDKEGEDEDGLEEEKKVTIDVEGFEYRAVRIPFHLMELKESTLSGEKLVSLEKNMAAVNLDLSSETCTLKQFDLETKEEAVIIEGVEDFVVSADGKKVMYKSGDIYGIIDLFPGFVIGDGQINTSDMEMLIDPREEWKQIFYEAWRIERDFFYDSQLHQVDWQGVKERYEKLLPFVTSRNDLNYIIGEMLGELNVGHAYVSGGDTERSDERKVGMLGIDFELDKET